MWCVWDNSSVCEHEQSLEMVSYYIHSILLLLVIWHPNLVSLIRQGPLEKGVKVIHIVSLIIGQLVIANSFQGYPCVGKDHLLSDYCNTADRFHTQTRARSPIGR